MLRKLFSFGLRNVTRDSIQQISKKSLPRVSWQQLYCSDVPAESEAEREKRKKIILLEIEVCRQEGLRAPEGTDFKPAQWEELLSLETRAARLRYYAFLCKIEIDKQAMARKKERHVAKVAERRAREIEQSKENNHLTYGLHHNTMFLRIYDTTMDKFYNKKLIDAAQFGEKLVFDCSYDEHMGSHEARNTAKQLSICFAKNRNHPDPFDIHFCNVDFEKLAMSTLQVRHPTMRNPEYPMNLHAESYLKVFPKEKLVYLTPHCREELYEYKPDDIYIIGAIVDKRSSQPLSLAKAKSQGLRMAKLPLDRYLRWGSGSGKSLTLDQMVEIMLEIKSSGDWNEALKFVPRRKLFEAREKAKERAAGQMELSDFKDYKFNAETWGPSKIVTQSEKRVAKRLNHKTREVVLESILGEEK